MGFTIYHLDVKQAYTRAKLDCKIVMKLPGRCGELSSKYVDLKKAFYGLKQSGLLWNDLLVEKLVTAHGMEQCMTCLLYTSPSPRDLSTSRMPSSA